MIVLNWMVFQYISLYFKAPKQLQKFSLKITQMSTLKTTTETRHFILRHILVIDIVFILFIEMSYENMIFSVQIKSKLLTF